MAFALPPIKSKPEYPDHFNVPEGEYGVPEIMKFGLTSAKLSTSHDHPLQISQGSYSKNRDKMNMAILRNTQGLHAPLKLAMEQKFASKVGRLPFLPSSNLMLDTLTGRDIEMQFEDVLNLPEFWEHSAQPHAVVEKSLGIL